MSAVMTSQKHTLGTAKTIWQPIADLPADWNALASTELAGLAPIRKKHAEQLREDPSLDEFNLRLKREWAIETGIIENLYSIDIGTTQLLIERGIEASLIQHGSSDRPAEEIVPMLKDQEIVLEGLFEYVAQRRDLSAPYIKQLHSAFTLHQPTVTAMNGHGREFEADLLRGQWKNLPNNPTRQNGTVHEYCPPVHVDSEMDRLVSLHASHGSVPPEVEAAWLHHRFTQIHPFQDGNGRMARALATIVFLRAGWFPVVVRRDQRSEYIDALEAADGSDLRSLVRLFVEIQKDAFNQAINVSKSVSRTQTRQVIEAAAEQRRARHERQLDEYRGVFQTAEDLSKTVLERVSGVADEIRAIIGDGAEMDTVGVNIRSSDAETDYWFYQQVIECAKSLGYFADTRSYKRWVRLRITEERQTEIVVHFHSMGPRFAGVLATSAFVVFRDRLEGGGHNLEGPYDLCRNVFQFAYSEPQQAVCDRFDQWLEHALVNGLELWRRQI